MPLEVLGTRIMVFMTEDDRVGHLGLHEVLLERAREHGMAGATVWRGIEGFGSSRRVRTLRFPDMAAGLPLALEVIDVPEQVESFLAAVRELAPDSLVTREQVQMTRFKPPPASALDDPSPRGRQRR